MYAYMCIHVHIRTCIHAYLTDGYGLFSLCAHRLHNNEIYTRTCIHIYICIRITSQMAQSFLHTDYITRKFILAHVYTVTYAYAYMHTSQMAQSFCTQTAEQENSYSYVYAHLHTHTYTYTHIHIYLTDGYGFLSLSVQGLQNNLSHVYFTREFDHVILTDTSR
jgi:hypothetical protein